MTMAVALAALLARGAPSRRQRRQIARGDDVVELAVLLGLAIDAGMNLAPALAWVRPHVHPALAGEITRLVRGARLWGLADQLRRSSGSAADLFQRIARAFDTGAELGPMIAAHVDQLVAEQRAEAAARAQRLPIKLLFPLTLLMLPGLVLMLAGPALVDVLARFT